MYYYYSRTPLFLCFFFIIIILFFILFFYFLFFIFFLFFFFIFLFFQPRSAPMTMMLTFLPKDLQLRSSSTFATNFLTLPPTNFGGRHPLISLSVTTLWRIAWHAAFCGHNTPLFEFYRKRFLRFCALSAFPLRTLFQNNGRACYCLTVMDELE